MNPKVKKKLKSLLFAVAVALTLRWAVVEAYVIPSGSMLPTLLIHDHIFVNKLVYGLRIPFSKMWLKEFREPKRGEIIVFKFPEDESIFFIKRVVGQAGDKIFYSEKGLFINGQLVETHAPSSTWDFDWLTESDTENALAQHGHKTEDLDPAHHHSIIFRTDASDMTAGPLEVPPHALFVMGDHRDNSKDSRFWGFVPVENVLGKAMFVWLSCDRALPYIEVGCDPSRIRWGRFFHRVN